MRLYVEFYQFAIAGFIVFVIQMGIPIWIVGWKLKLPGDDAEDKKRFRFKAIASFVIGALLSFIFICVLDLVFGRS